MTNKQRAFIEEYLIDFNGTQAAIRAGYSPKTANRIASNLLSKVDIQKAIEDRLKELQVSANEVLLRLGKQARGEEPTKITEKDGEIKREYDMKGALESVGKAHALFVDKQVIEFSGLEVVDDDEEASSQDPSPSQ